MQAVGKILPQTSILIVEDEAIVAAYQKALIGGAGHYVLGPFADAERALAAADEIPPDIAIVDVTLAGGIDGITVGRELNRRHGTTIVFVTGSLEQAVRQMRGLDAVFVGKPFRSGEILDAVDEALRRRN